jgi:excisionase family DNA binding protein
MSALPNTSPTSLTNPSDAYPTDARLTAVYFPPVLDEDTEPVDSSAEPIEEDAESVEEDAEPTRPVMPPFEALPNPFAIEALEAYLGTLVDCLIQKHLDALSASQTPDPLWDVDEVAAYLGVSRRTVDTLIAGGEIKPMRVGRQRRFHRKAIDAYLRSTIS